MLAGLPALSAAAVTVAALTWAVPGIGAFAIWAAVTVPAVGGLFMTLQAGSRARNRLQIIEYVIERGEAQQDIDGLFSNLGGLLASLYDISLLGYRLHSRSGVSGETKFTPGIEGSPEFRAAIAELLGGAEPAALEYRRAVTRSGEMLGPAQQDILDGLDAASFVVVPVIWGERLYAAACFSCNTTDLPVDNARYMALLASQLAGRIELWGSGRARQREDIETAAHTRLEGALDGPRNVDDAITVFVRLTRNIVKCDGAGLIAVDLETDAIAACHGSGALSEWNSSPDRANRVWSQMRDRISDKPHEPLRLTGPDLSALIGNPGDYPAGSAIIAPLRPNGLLTGALIVVRTTDATAFSNSDAENLESLSRHIGVEVENAYLYTKHRADQQKIERLTRIQTGMVSNVSHELRTSLSSLKTATDLLLDRDSVKVGSENFDRLLQSIARNVARQETMIANIVDLAGLEDSTLTLSLDEVEIHELFGEIAASMGPQINQRGQALNVTASADVRRFIADRQRISQVLVNLIGNARKFAPEDSKISVSASLWGNEVVFCVSDEGPGVPGELRHRIFDRLHREGNQTEQSPAEGGLGLPVSRALVELHGGKIWVEDSPSGGAAFMFSVPVEGPDEDSGH
jgi:signal transduction histidine kinase